VPERAVISSAGYLESQLKSFALLYSSNCRRRLNNRNETRYCEDGNSAWWKLPFQMLKRKLRLVEMNFPNAQTQITFINNDPRLKGVRTNPKLHMVTVERMN
jgi:hypothetical protein